MVCAKVGPLISPVIGMPWAYRVLDGTLQVGRISEINVEHPDAWMAPIRDRPVPQATGQSARDSTPITA